MFQYTRLSLIMSIATIAATCGWSTATAEEFRVENKVYVDREEEPRATSTTIFVDGVVYDYLNQPNEITIFDSTRGRFVLLDVTRHVRMELTAEQVSAMSERIKVWAEKQADPYLNFLARPQFDEQWDETTGDLSLASKWITYQLKTAEVENPAIARQYREFSDWYCQLNTAMNPGSRPPFSRLLVNESLARHERFPTEVQLTVRSQGGVFAKKTVIRSEHQLISRLVESDRARVSQTHQYIAMFPQVGLGEYLKSER